MRNEGEDLAAADLRSGYVTLQVRSLPAVAGLVGLGVMHFVPPLVPVAVLIGTLAAPLAFLGHALALRLLLINPARRAFRGSRSRRIVVRWSCRLFFLGAAPAAYGTLLVPGLGLFVAPLSFYAINAVIYGYLRWHASRHRLGRGIHALEKFGLVVAGVAAIAGFVLVLALAFAAGLLVEWP